MSEGIPSEKSEIQLRLTKLSQILQLVPRILKHTLVYMNVDVDYNNMKK